MPKPGEHKTAQARILTYSQEISLLHFFVPNHGKLWKSLMRVHLGDYEALEAKLRLDDEDNKI